MTDPKSRKVIVIENTYLPAWVKEHIAEALFENLKVSSPTAIR
jgi:actin-related protein 10